MQERSPARAKSVPLTRVHHRRKGVLAVSPPSRSGCAQRVKKNNAKMDNRCACRRTSAETQTHGVSSRGVVMKAHIENDARGGPP